MGSLRDTVAGIAVTLTIAMISFLASSLHPSFNPLVISIIFGMLVSNMFAEREMFEKGVNAAMRIFLPVGIGLYGLQLSFVGETSGSALVILAVAVTVCLSFLIAFYIARGFGLGSTLSLLLGTGLSVCGASAIIVMAPLLKARKEDTSIAVISVMAVGLTGMLIYGFLPEASGLSVKSFAFLTGVTLPMIGQVKVAASAMGEESLAMAMNFKLLRVLSLLVLAALVLFFSGGKNRKFHVPWFMVVFFLLAFASNLSREVAMLRGFFAPVSTFLLSAALASIGLSLDFESITEAGAAPLFAAFLSWGIVAMGVYLILSLTV